VLQVAADFVHRPEFIGPLSRNGTQVTEGAARYWQGGQVSR